METGFGTGACAAKPETPSPPEREKGGSRGVMSQQVRVSTSPFGAGQRRGDALQRGGSPVSLVPCHSCSGPMPAYRTETSLLGGISRPLLHSWGWLGGRTQKDAILDAKGHCNVDVVLVLWDERR